MKLKQFNALLLAVCFLAHFALDAMQFNPTDPAAAINYMYDRLPKVNPAMQTRLKAQFSTTYGLDWDEIDSRIKNATTRGLPQSTAIQNVITGLQTEKRGFSREQDTLKRGVAGVPARDLLIFYEDAVAADKAGGGAAVDKDLLAQVTQALNQQLPAYTAFYHAVVTAVDSNVNIKAPWAVNPQDNPPVAIITANQATISAKIRALGAPGGGMFANNHSALKPHFILQATPPISAQLRYPGWTTAKDGSLDSNAKVEACVENLANGVLIVVNEAFSDDPAYTTDHQAWFNAHLVDTPATAGSLFAELTQKITTLKTACAAHLPGSAALSQQSIELRAELVKRFAALDPVLTTNADVTQAAKSCVTLFGKQLEDALKVAIPALKAGANNSARIKTFFGDYWAACYAKIGGGGAAAAPNLDAEIEDVELAYGQLAQTLNDELLKATMVDPNKAIPNTTNVTNKELFNMIQRSLTNMQKALIALDGKIGRATPGNITNPLHQQIP